MNISMIFVSQLEPHLRESGRQFKEFKLETSGIVRLPRLPRPHLLLLVEGDFEKLDERTNGLKSSLKQKKISMSVKRFRKNYSTLQWCCYHPCWWSNSG